MKRHNYYSWFINRYNSMPRLIRPCIYFVMRLVCGNSWHETFVLKGIQHFIDQIEKNMQYDRYRLYKNLKDRQKDMSKEYTEIVNNNFWDLI